MIAISVREKAGLVMFIIGIVGSLAALYYFPRYFKTIGSLIGTTFGAIIGLTFIPVGAYLAFKKKSALDKKLTLRKIVGIDLCIFGTCCFAWLWLPISFGQIFYSLGQPAPRGVLFLVLFDMYFGGWHSLILWLNTIVGIASIVGGAHLIFKK